MSIFKQVRDYNRLVDLKSKEFSEWMVSFLMQHPEFHAVLNDVESDPKKKRDLMSDMFRCWIQDPDKMEWFFQHEMIKRGL